RAISYDYCKQTFGMMVLKGFDGMDREIQSTVGKIVQKSSAVLVVYFYYMQVQQLIFRGKWATLPELRNKEHVANAIFDLDQRQQYFKKISVLLKVWRWNGIDFPLFLIAVLGIISMPGQSLNFLAYGITLQFLFTYFLHIYWTRNL
ncbi:MAG: hypothetical protein HN646_10590, partial [Nitrospina sp.]|nr:hypothetical protein [Nitrospina sp.]